MIEVKQGEGKKIWFTILENNTPVNVSEANLTFGVKRRKTDSDYAILKTNDDFDKSNASSGVVGITLGPNDTNQTPAIYTGELQIVFNDGVVSKTEDIKIIIEAAVIR